MAAETHSDVMKRFQNYWDADRNNRDDALEDQRFLGGDQWPEGVRRIREADGKPVITVNRMGQFVRQVSGMLRQTSPAIDPFPTDDKTDPVLTDIYAGIIRQIEYQSGASSVYSWGAECQISCGIGHWRVDTKYVDDGFDQEICIKRIVDPLSVLWDSNSGELDRSDAYECFVMEWVTEDEYYRRFPKQRKDGIPTDMPADMYKNGLFWREDNKFRIASKWCKTPKKKKIGMTQDGQVFDLERLSRIALQSLGITREREIDSFEIKHQVMSGDDFLTDVEDWAGKYIPVIPCIGAEVPIDGQIVRHGIVRWAKDPQRLYNYWRSTAAETIALAPKAPWLATPDHIKGYESMWLNANRQNSSVLLFNADSAVPGLVPQRQQPAAPPAAMWQEAQVATADMEAATGMYPSSLGKPSNENSGVAIEERQQQSDNGTFIYFDNFNHAIRRTGQVLVDLIPKIYDSERVVRMLGVDGSESFAPINKTVMDVYGPVLVNDLSAGKFDVRIKTGPSYASARQEARDQLGKIIAEDPTLMQVFGDIYFENLDFPDSKKLAARMKKVIKPEILAGEEGQEQPPPDPMAQMAMKTQLDEALAKIEKLKAESFKTEQVGIGQQIDNQTRMISVAEHGIEPPAHVQKQDDREHDMTKTRLGHTVQMTEAERGRQFTKEQAAQQPAE